LVDSEVDHTAAIPTVRLERFPASLAQPGHEPGHAQHLAVGESERDYRLRESAAVLSRSGVDDAPPLEMLERYPGCRVAIAKDAQANHLQAAVRGQTPVTVTVDGDADVQAAGSALYAAWVGGLVKNGWPAAFEAVLGSRTSTLRIIPGAHRAAP
jgi:hypothetical protein